jgi:hypothetical protein
MQQRHQQLTEQYPIIWLSLAAQLPAQRGMVSFPEPLMHS